MAAPSDDVSEATFNVGSIHVFRGTSDGLTVQSSSWTQADAPAFGSPESFDNLGRRMAAGDIDGDGRDDLVVTVADPGPAGDPGNMLHIFMGTAEGLSHHDVLFQADVVGPSEYEAFFGESLAFGEVTGDSYDDLIVAAYRSSSGGVHVIPGSASGLDLDSAVRIVQETAGIGLSSELEDSFGTSLALGDFDGDGIDELAVGYYEGLGFAPEIVDAGAVVVIDGLAEHITLDQPLESQFWHQDVDGISDEAEGSDFFSWVTSGDFDGDGYADLVIGVSGEDIETPERENAGALHVLYGSPSGLGTAGEQFGHQGAWSIGTTDVDDSMGPSIAAGDFDGDGADELAVGIPFEDLLGGVDAGFLGVIRGQRPFPFADDFELGDLRLWTLWESGPDN